MLAKKITRQCGADLDPLRKLMFGGPEKSSKKNLPEIDFPLASSETGILTNYHVTIWT